MALGVSGKALLTMLIVSGLLCFLPVIFSHRRVPGSIVSGGSNTLVLSAACHASVLARYAPTKDPDAASTEDDSHIGQTASRQKQSSRNRRNSGSCFANIKAPLSPYDHWSTHGEIAAETVMGTGSQENEEGRLLLPFETPQEQEEYELSLLREVTLGKVKWGAMNIEPELLSSLNIDGIDGPVKHLGFGSKEDRVETPQEGHFYV